MSKSKNKDILFSINDIEELATNTSFERGEDYFLSGSVQGVVKTGNRFEAVVYGTQKYKVTLIDDKDGLNLHCNCPYDFGGICKHLVAFALTILDGDYQEIAVKTMPTLPKDTFKTVYSETTSKKKLLFLEQLLDRDNDLKQQFMSFSKDTTENLDTIVGEKLEDVKFEINAALSNLNFDNLRYDYDDDNYGYRDQWEVESDAAIAAIEDAFNPYISSIHNYIRKGNLLDAIRVTLGLYEGTQNLPELDNENMVFDGRYNEEVQVIVKETIRDISVAIRNIVKSDHSVLKLITLIFERISYYTNPKNKEKISYCIKDFEFVFHSLIINKKTAVFLHKTLQESNLESLSSAFIVLNIAEISEDEKLWLETAETYASLDATITKQLLESYKSKELSTDFNRIAKMALNNWANEFDKYLIDNLDKKQQEVLFVKALKNYVSKKQNIEYYHTLKTYLTKEETLTFVDKFKDTYHRVFYVQLLEIEKRYLEILACVNKNKEVYELEKLIKPILNIYPAECFTIIVGVNTKAMSAYKRNRGTYQTMVKTLKLLKEINFKKDEVNTFLKELYNHKPNLPALRDEMKKSKINYILRSDKHDINSNEKVNYSSLVKTIKVVANNFFNSF